MYTHFVRLPLIIVFSALLFVQPRSLPLAQATASHSESASSSVTVASWRHDYVTAHSGTSSHPSIIPTRNGVELEFVGTIGGSITTVTATDSLAYIGEGTGLTVLDISNPIQPTRRSRIELPDVANSIDIVGNLAYIANGSDGLTIIDVTNLDNLSILSTYGTLGFANDLQVTGDLAYMADETSGLKIMNVSDPVSKFLLPTGYPTW